MNKNEIIQNMKLYLFDMDGTLYLGSRLYDFTIELLQEIRRTDGRFDVEAHIVEAAHQRQRLLLILIRHADQYRSVVFQRHPGCGHCFVRRPMQFAVVTDRLACGFHFRRQIGVHTAQF